MLDNLTLEFGSVDALNDYPASGGAASYSDSADDSSCYLKDLGPDNWGTNTVQETQRHCTLRAAAAVVASSVGSRVDLCWKSCEH